MLIARLYEVFPLVCLQCGGELKIVAFLTEVDSIQRLLICLSVNRSHRLESRLPRAPPDRLEADFDQSTVNDSEATEPIPQFEFDQTRKLVTLQDSSFSRCSDGLMEPAQALICQ